MLFDLTNVDTSDLIPDGDYVLAVDNAEMKETKNGTGEYLNVRFRIVEGKYEGRNLFHLFNIKNQNALAVEIGMRELKKFLIAAGVTNFSIASARELLGLRALGKIKSKSDEFGEKNYVASFKPCGGLVPEGSNPAPGELPF